MTPVILTFSHYYRDKYGEPVGKIPIDNGYTCPNRKKGGCLFCSPKSFTPGYLDEKESLACQIKQGKEHLLANRFRLYFAYFQQETCTVAPIEELLRQTGLLLADEDCVGVIFSTRPDCVSEELLEPLSLLMKQKGRECHFELGLQSAHESSLEYLNRNHSLADFDDCVTRLQKYENFAVGAHLILGIPGETRKAMADSVTHVCSLGIDSLKLHHLQVVCGTPLADVYQRGGEVKLFDKDDYVQLLLDLLPLIPAHIIIHRLWAHSHPDLLLAPKWNVLPGILSTELRAKMKELKVFQGCRVVK